MWVTSHSAWLGGVTVSQVASPDDSTLTATLSISSGLSPETEARLLDILCCEGCIMGAGFSTEEPVFKRRSDVSTVTRARDSFTRICTAISALAAKEWPYED